MKRILAVTLLAIIGCSGSPVVEDLPEQETVITDPSFGRISAHRFACPAFDGTGTCVCDASDYMDDWSDWAWGFWMSPSSGVKPDDQPNPKQAKVEPADADGLSGRN